MSIVSNKVKNLTGKVLKVKTLISSGQVGSRKNHHKADTPSGNPPNSQKPKASTKP
jgi:hypothetical protein